MIRHISIIYKHRFEERITKKRLYLLFVYFVIEFWTAISQFSHYKIQIIIWLGSNKKYYKLIFCSYYDCFNLIINLLI